jgi:hypothetical protein
MLKSVCFMTLSLFMSVGVLIALPNAATAKNLDTSTTVTAVKHASPEFEIVVDPGFASPANWRELHRRIQEQNRKFQESRKGETARGGVDLGGGVSVVDPKTGKRRLLDFVEPDDWNYVDYIRVGWGFIGKLSVTMARDLVSAYQNSLADFGDDGPLNTKTRLLMGLTASAILDFQSPADRGASNHFNTFLWRKNLHDLQILLQRRVQENGRVVRWVFVDFPLELLNDEGFIRLVDPVTKRQVAIQKDGIVIIQRAEYKLLDDESEAGLFMHEGVLFSLLTLKPEIIAAKGTEPVRKIVRRMFEYQKAYIAFKDQQGIDTATIMNRRMAVEDAVRELVELGF